MNNVDIRRVTLQDVILLQEISRQTFFETFSALNTEENMNKYLKESLSEERLTMELNDENSDFYFASFNDRVIGYLKLNFGQSQTELKDNTALEIERIYVLQDYQGKNIGYQLYKKALEVAMQKKVNYIWLGVWEKNLKAIDFYKKNGFIEFDKHIFKLGDDEQTDIMMRLQFDNK